MDLLVSACLRVCSFTFNVTCTHSFRVILRDVLLYKVNAVSLPRLSITFSKNVSLLYLTHLF